MSLKNNYKNKEWLNEQYITLEKEILQISEEYGISYHTIYYWLKKFDIKRRRIYKNKEWLNEQYITLEREILQISEECRVSYGTIYYWLKKFDIKRRRIYLNKEWLEHQYITLKKTITQISEEFGVSFYVISFWLKRFDIWIRTLAEAQRGDQMKGERHQNKEWLEHQYITLKKSTTQISEECSVSYGTIYYWLRKFKIKIRTISEAMILFKKQTKKGVI